MTDDAFIMALGRAALRQQCVRGRGYNGDPGKRPRAWCLNCQHVQGSPSPRRAKRGNQGDQGESGEDNQCESDDETHESECEVEELDEEVSGEGEGAAPQHQVSPSRKAYFSLQRKSKNGQKGRHVKLFSSDGNYSPGVYASLNAIRGCGVGVEATGFLLSYIVECLTGSPIRKRKGKPVRISKRTVRKGDALAGPLSVQQFLTAAKAQGVDATALAQDAGAGCRDAHGIKMSGVAVSVPHPHDSDCVVQAVVDLRHSVVGTAEGKAEHGGVSGGWVGGSGSATPCINNTIFPRQQTQGPNLRHPSSSIEEASSI